MKRRDLLKTALIAAGGAFALSGCKSTDEKPVIKDSDVISITPKQTGIYKFSTPLTFNHEYIDELAKHNQTYKKSQIDVLYNNLPWPATSKYNEWFHTKRGENNKIKNFNDFKQYAKHAMDNGFRVCYLVNSPKPFNDKDAEPLLKDFYKLLDDIYAAGIRDIKFSNPQVAELITNHNKEFKLTASVLLEYHNIAQYENLIRLYPNITRIVVTKDENQNFKFLKNLRKMFPDITIEMMLNEGCIKNCPSRIACMSDSETTYIGNHLGCYYVKNDPILTFYKNGTIKQWDLGYYSAIGINDFKLVQNINRAEDTFNRDIKPYMDFVEYGFESELLQKYVLSIMPFSEVYPEDIKVSQFVPYFQDMKFFVKNGHKCGDICGLECRYCEQKADKLQEFIESFG